MGGGRRLRRRLPTPEEAVKGLPLLLDCAAMHLKVADLTADAGEYGVARAHLVLALEELAKAQACGWIWIERDAEVKTYDQHDMLERFNFHSARHWPSLLRSWSGGALAELALATIRRDFSIGSSTVAGNDLVQDVLKRHPEALDETWLEDANQHKENGLYVDMQDNGKWRSPHEVTREQFDQLRPAVDYQLKQLRELASKEIPEG